MKREPCFAHGVGAVSAVIAFAFAIVFTLRAAEPRTISDLALTLVPIPAGTFIMGSPPTEAVRRDNEGPQTRVTITRSFWLGVTEVTHGQWRAIMGTDLAEQARRMLADDTLYAVGGKHQTMRDWKGAAKDSDPKAQLFDTADDVPMHFVNWEEAASFCRKLTERERAAGRMPADYEYRLPTEAEWEYACRAGTTEATYAGEVEVKAKNNAPVLDRIAWYGGNSSVDYTGEVVNPKDWTDKRLLEAYHQHSGGHAGAHAVGTKRPNDFGLYDTLGNVWEWCGDWYAAKLPGGDVRDPIGPDSGTLSVFRGGGWNDPPDFVRAAMRYWRNTPGIRSNALGFRVALAPLVTH